MLNRSEFLKRVGIAVLAVPAVAGVAKLIAAEENPLPVKESEFHIVVDEFWYINAVAESPYFPIGMVHRYALGPHWLKCDGSKIPARYSELKALCKPHGGKTPDFRAIWVVKTQSHKKHRISKKDLRETERFYNDKSIIHEGWA